VAIGERLIIVGPNASGKSNLLDSIRFLRDLSRDGGGLQPAVRSRGGLSRVRCLFARNSNKGQVEITVTLGDDADLNQWTYSISFNGEKGGLNRPIVARELVKRGDTVIIERPDAADREDSERLIQTALEQISENNDFRVIAEFLAETRYLHLVPEIIRDASRSGDQRDDPYGGDFIARMNRVSPKTRDSWLVCRNSRKPSIKRGMVPPTGSVGRVGSEYVTLISSYAHHAWRPDIAAANAPSLARALKEIDRLISTGVWR
jgi:hypothetical protein